MEFRNHLGILILITLMFFLIWALSAEQIKKYKWYISLGAGVVIMLIFETIYWTIQLCFF
jgi:hypothetical protein